MRLLCLCVASLVVVGLTAIPGHGQSLPEVVLDEVGAKQGVCAFLGLPEEGKQDAILALARASEMLIYVQSASQDELTAIRQAAEKAGLLGKQIWVGEGAWKRIQLADNIADFVLVGPAGRGQDGVSREEVLRVLHPRAKGHLGKEQVVKPTPEGLDDWDHPYHGPDNNPQSTDRVARYPYLTQFLATPMFGCISEMTVASGGRIYKAFGHIAFKEVQNEVLNTLYTINAYNGTILWKRNLKDGFMIHRNTMIATPDALYLGDDESCKVLDGKTGKILREIKPAADVAGGTVWKWMAMHNGTLYALMGGEEVKAALKPGTGKGYGGWPWGMWQGYDYQDPSKSFAFGQTFLALEPETGKILWKHRADGYLDGRAVCMFKDRIYAYCPDKFLVCLDANTGKSVWQSADQDVLSAIGRNGRAQKYLEGFATTAYMKCNEKYLFLAGPQRSRLVAIHASDGKLAWQREPGNLQLVLREDALYAFGQQNTKSFRVDYDTGKTLTEFKDRRACTRATGSIDGIFCRARGGTMRYDPSANSVQHIAPMRPPCHDGVLISEGYLYWGPWICQCQLALFGHIALGPAGDFDFTRKADEKSQLAVGQGGPDVKESRAGLSFQAAPDGVVRAIDKTTGKEVWKYYTGGEINFPPVIWEHRVYAGSNDGHVYALEADTGRLLWRFQAAPDVRRIPVYGKLASTWPVAGGVAVEDGIVYAAAGIAHYDGTHVYALDARTGKIKWHNGESGFLNPDLRSGVSLAGQLRIATQGTGKVLVFEGGNAVVMGTYDLASGKCLTPAPTQPVGVSKSEFYLRELLKKQQE